VCASLIACALNNPNLQPSGAFKDNVVGKIATAGRKLVQPCIGDGYTRIDVQCGCADCYC
jgi:hypothetical protein